MFQITGSYGTANIVCDTISESVKSKLMGICNDRISIDSNIMLFPGAYCDDNIINGIAMTVLSDRLNPTIVNSDIGCGILCCKIKCREQPNLEKLDHMIRHLIPSDNRIHNKRVEKIPFEKLLRTRKFSCATHIDMSKCINSIGTLGRGEHYIQLAEGSDGYYLIIHAGSRLYGEYVYKYYNALYSGDRESIKSPRIYSATYKVLDFARDANTLYYAAYCNRATICNIITRAMGWQCDDSIDKTHNYIVESPHGGYIIRNNVQPAHSGSKVIIPSDTANGIILGTAKNISDDYMSSAPGSSGRIHSKEDVSKKYSLADYKHSMHGIYCTTLSANNMYTAPMVYNSLDYIKDPITWIDTNSILRPIYMFKPIT